MTGSRACRARNRQAEPSSAGAVNSAPAGTARSPGAEQDAGQNQAYTAAKDQSPDVLTRRAECNPDRDFRPALRHTVTKNAVNSDDRQQQRDTSKASGKAGLEAGRPDRQIDR